MREIWLMQPRFERRSPNSALALAGQPRFRAGYDFLRLRADCGDLPTELADWWEDFHLGNDEDREALLDDLRSTQAPRARRAPAAAASGDDAAPAPPAADGEAAPRKRRRRRRRPAGARDEGAPPAPE
jgi:poly(A) polymerase